MNDLVLVFMFICFKKQFLAKVALWPTFKPKRLFLEHLMCKRVDRIMLRVRSLSQISEPNIRVQAAVRYGNLEAKPSR